MKPWLMTFPEDRPSIPVYRGWLERAGIPSILLLQGDAEPALDEIGALLLPGGGDVEPTRYGDAIRHPKTYGVQPAQDALEADLIGRCLSAGLPVFGICRGLQMLNVALGGKLIQHVPDIVPERRERHRKKGSYDALHPLVATTDSAFGRILAAAPEVNSAHHQAIDPGVVAPALRVVATSRAGVVEAVESLDVVDRISAVQWHPERLPDGHPASTPLLTYWRALAEAT